MRLPSVGRYYLALLSCLAQKVSWCMDILIDSITPDAILIIIYKPIITSIMTHIITRRRRPVLFFFQMFLILLIIGFLKIQRAQRLWATTLISIQCFICSLLWSTSRWLTHAFVLLKAKLLSFCKNWARYAWLIFLVLIVKIQRGFWEFLGLWCIELILILVLICLYFRSWIFGWPPVIPWFGACFLW